MGPGSQEFDHWFREKVDVASRTAWSILPWCSETKEEPGRGADDKHRHPLQRREEQVAMKGNMAAPKQGI